MESFLEEVEKNIINNNLEAISLFRKCLSMLIIKNTGNFIENFIDICIEKKFINVLKIILKYEFEIDSKILSNIAKNFDENIINIFSDNGVKIDEIIKISFSEFIMSQDNILKLMNNPEFYKSPKSYLLVYAAHYGYESVIDNLLINNEIEEIDHALLHAIYNNQIQCIQKLLLVKSLDINKYIIQSHLNCCIGKSDIYKKCLATYGRRGMYPLTAAVKKNDIKILNILLSNKADPNYCIYDKSKSILNIAIINNNLDIVKVLLNECIVIKDYVEYEEIKELTFTETFYMNSLQIENLSINPLIVWIINITQKNNLANSDKYIEILHLLLRKKISVNSICSKIKLSPFTVLCSYEVFCKFPKNLYFKILEIFIKYEGNVNLGLLSACNVPSNLENSSINNKDNSIVIEKLIDNKANVNFTENQYSPLVISVLKKNYNNVYCLLENNADPNIINIENNTPLNCCLLKFNFNSEIINFIECYTNYIKDFSFSNKFFVKLNSNVFDILELLISFGADINMKDTTGFSFKEYIEKSIDIVKINRCNMFEDSLELLQILLGCLLEPVTPSIYYKYKIKSKEFEEFIIPDIPPSYICPISKYPLIDPVIASDGFTYSRKSFILHLDYSDRSPVTQEKLKNFEFTPNYIMKSLVEEKVNELVNTYMEF